MSIEEFIKQIKKLKDIKINCEIKDNIFFGYIQGIINNMDKKKRITNEDLALEMRAGFKSINERLDKVEYRLDNIEKCPTIQEELSYIKNGKSEEPTMREMIKQLVKDMADIKNCPTIKKELQEI